MSNVFDNHQPPPSPLVKPMFHIMVKHWWLLSINGVFLIIAGSGVIASPFQTYLALSKIFAFSLICTGVLDLFFAWNNRHNKHGVWRLMAGTADVVMGIFLFYNVLIAIFIFPLTIGLWTFLKVFIAFGDVIHIRNYSTSSWRRIIFLILVIAVIAIFLLLCPVIGIENIFLFSGTALIAMGCFRIFLSVKLYRIKQIEKAFAQ